jgi:hypothetical protein
MGPRKHACTLNTPHKDCFGPSSLFADSKTAGVSLRSPFTSLTPLSARRFADGESGLRVTAMRVKSAACGEASSARIVAPPCLLDR